MAHKRIDELTSLTSLEGNDLFIVYDVSEPGSEKTKKITKTNLEDLLEIEKISKDGSELKFNYRMNIGEVVVFNLDGTDSVEICYRDNAAAFDSLRNEKAVMLGARDTDGNRKTVFLGSAIGGSAMHYAGGQGKVSADWFGLGIVYGSKEVSLELSGSDPKLRNKSGDTFYIQGNDAKNIFYGNEEEDCRLYYNGTEKLRTSTEGILTKSIYVDGSMTITGSLTVQGSQFIANVEEVQIEDNLLLLNKNETGPGVTAGVAGIEIERGTATNYKFIFDETTDTFRIGMEGELQAVATRQDEPTNSGIAFWNNIAKRFDTSSTITAQTIENKADKVSGGTSGNLVKRNASGNLEDAGVAISSSTPSLGDSLVFNGTLWVPGRPAPRNIIWQGGMQLWQEAPSGYTGIGTASIRINDGWAVVTPGLTSGRCSIQPDTNNNAPPGRSIMTTCTATQSAIGDDQHLHIHARIEGNDIAILGYGTSNALTSNLSMWVNCVGHSGTYTFYVWTSDGSTIYAYKFKKTLNTGWNYIQQTIPALTAINPRDGSATVGIVLAAGSSAYDSNENAWANYNLGQFKPGLSGQNNFFSSTSNRIDIASVQWTPGPYPLPFLDRPIAETLAIAQRYYEKSYGLGTAPGTAVYGGAVLTSIKTGGFVPGTRFAVRKRANPTTTLYSPGNGASGNVYNVTAGSNAAHGAVVVGQAGIDYTSCTGTLHDTITYHWVADARI